MTDSLPKDQCEHGTPRDERCDRCWWAEFSKQQPTSNPPWSEVAKIVRDWQTGVESSNGAMIALCSLVSRAADETAAVHGHPGIDFLHHWMRTQNPLLGDVTPLDMMRMGRGAKLAQFIESAYEENTADHSTAVYDRKDAENRCKHDVWKGDHCYQCAADGD